jgi:hypothetical protein
VETPIHSLKFLLKKAHKRNREKKHNRRKQRKLPTEVPLFPLAPLATAHDVGFGQSTPDNAQLFGHWLTIASDEKGLAISPAHC